MGQKITIEVTQGEGLACTNSFSMEQGIKVVHAIQACEYFLKVANEKVVEYGEMRGWGKDVPVSELAAKIENLNLEDIF